MQANPQRQQKILNRLAKQKTVREYLQNIKETHYKEVYKGKKVSKLSNIELQEYAQQSTSLIRELSSRIDEVYNVIGYNLNDFKSYSIDELQSMVDKINEDYDNPEFLMNHQKQDLMQQIFHIKRVNCYVYFIVLYQ